MSYLTINKKYSLKPNSNLNEQIEALLDEKEEFEATKLDNSLIKIISKVSWGVLIIRGGGGGFPIYVIVDSSNSKTHGTLNIKTKIRKENYFLFGMLILFEISGTFSNEDIWTHIFVVGLFIVSHFWFHFIYRLQENVLIKKVVSKLQLKEVDI